MTTYVYVGTYTGPGRGEGIYVFRLDDPATGRLTPVQTFAEIVNPSFQATHPSSPILYSVERELSREGQVGGVAALAIDPASGRLSRLNQQPSHGAGPCYVSAHPAGRHVFVANYNSGHIAAYPTGPDSSLGEATDVIHHEGNTGPNARRQEGPHAHFITSDPRGERVLACDLGLDRLMVYRLDQESGRLRPNELPYGQLSSGAGPRHLSFHPNGQFVYVINELDSTLSAFAYDAGRGALEIRHTASLLPDDFGGKNTGAQVVVHPSGRFVYGSNRGHDSIAIFGVDQATGRVRALGHEPTQGQNPRNFNVHPDGTLLLAANQDGDSVVAFRIDQAAGALQPTGEVVRVPSPACVTFFEA
jgi:6-phosphogluconolactonase